MNPTALEIQEIESEKAALARLTELRRWRRTDAPRLWAENDGCSVEVTSVLCAVSNVFRVPYPKLIGKSRSRVIAEARMLAMQILRDDLKLRVVQVAEMFRKHEHSTVIHACRRVREFIAKDRIFRARAAKVRELIQEMEIERQLVNRAAEKAILTTGGSTAGNTDGTDKAGRNGGRGEDEQEKAISPLRDKPRKLGRVNKGVRFKSGRGEGNEQAETKVTKTV